MTKPPCYSDDLPHILNGIYLSQTAKPQPEQVTASQIRVALLLGEEATLEGMVRVKHLPFKGTLTETQVREGAAFLHRQVSSGERVLVCCSGELPCAVVVILAYLIEYEGMDLANAYTLVAQSAFLIRLPAHCFITLMRAYGLPYKEQDLQDNYFTAHLVAWVRENLSRVHRAIHISGMTALERQTRTRQKGIEAVLRVDDSRRIGFNWSDEFILCDVPLADGREIEAEAFGRGIAFIAEQVEAGRNLLVHCEMGVSRSVTMVLAYLIRYEKMTLPQAYATVVKRRAIAHPHPRLFLCLVDYLNLPYTPEQALDLRFRDCLLMDAVNYASVG